MIKPTFTEEFYEGCYTQLTTLGHVMIKTIMTEEGKKLFSVIESEASQYTPSCPEPESE